MNAQPNAHFMDPFVIPFDHFEDLRSKIAAEAGPLLIRAHGIQDATALAPTAYVLPASWDPGPDPTSTGSPEDSTTAYLFGRPVMWDPEERMGLFYEVTP